MIKVEHKTLGVGTLLALEGDDRVYVEFIRGVRKTISRHPLYWTQPLPDDLTSLPTLEQYISEKLAGEQQAELERKDTMKKLLMSEKKSRKLRPHYRAPLHVRNPHDPAIVSLFLAGQDDFKVLAKRCETTVKHVKQVLLDRGLIDEAKKKSKRSSSKKERDADHESQQREDAGQVWNKFTIRERLDWLRQIEPGIPCFAVRHDLGTIVDNYGAEKLDESLERLVAPIRTDASDDDSTFSPADDEMLVGDEML